MPAPTPLLLTYDPRKALAAIPVLSGLLPGWVPPSASEPPGSSAAPKLLVLDEFWLLFPTPITLGGGRTGRYPDYTSTWQVLVHGDDESVQLFWEDVCQFGLLDADLVGVAGRDFVLAEETANAFVLECRCTLDHRHGVQELFEARYPQLEFLFD